MRGRTSTRVAAASVAGVALALVLVATSAGQSAVAAVREGLTLGQANRAEGTTTLQSTGGGPALRLKSRGRAPALAVSNSRLVKKLNADRVDGLNAEDLAPPTTRFVVARPGDSLRPFKGLVVRLPRGTYLMTGSGAWHADDNSSWFCFLGHEDLLRRNDATGVLVGDSGQGPGGVNLTDLVTIGTAPLAIGCTLEGENEVIAPLNFTFRPVGEVVNGSGRPLTQ